MRFGDAQMETGDVMPIAGTIVLCRQADRVIEEMRSELLQQAYPLCTSDTRGGFSETFEDTNAQGSGTCQKHWACDAFAL